MLVFYHSYPQPTVQLSFLSSTSQLCDLLLFLDNHVSSSDKGEECQWSAFNLGSSASNETVSRESSDLTTRDFGGSQFDQFDIACQQMYTGMLSWAEHARICQNSWLIRH